MVLTPLHVVPSTVHTVDARLGLLAGVAVAISFAWIWFPEQVRVGRRRIARAGLARTAAMTMLLLAVLPSVVPYDHLFGHVDMGGNESAVHAAHCHGSPGSCADAPVTSGPGQLLMSEPLLASPAMLAVRIHALVVILAGRAVPPDLRPPIA